MATAAEPTPTPPAATTDVDPAAACPLGGAAVYAAIAVLITFAVLVAHLIGQVGTDDEVRWRGLAWLFASVEAIAFGAGGALFGASGHRDRAERAEAAAKVSADAAANRRALAAAMQGGELQHWPRGARVVRPAGAIGTGPGPKRHAEFAPRLFP
jgi:hypothetical protein